MKSLLFVLLFLSLSTWAQNASDCPITPEQEKRVRECLTNFQNNECSELEVNESLKGQMISCHIKDIENNTDGSTIDYLQGCGVGIKDHIVATFNGIVALPSVVGEALTKTKEARRLAEAICNQKKKLSDRNLNLSSCIDRETVNIRNVHIDWDQYKKAIEELKLKSFCLKPKYRAQTLCPIGAEITALVAGGAILSSGKNFVKSSLQGLKHLREESAHRIEGLQLRAASQAEKKSILHQEDLLAISRNTEVMKDLKAIDIDFKALERGMIDSDIGKQDWAKKQFVNGSHESRDLIRFLQGKSSPVEQRLLKEIFEDSDLHGKTLLPSHLTESQIENVFKSQPIMTGFLHELPGIQAALSDFRGLRISALEFKKRLKANLFHNGPQEGFWKDLTEKFVPGTMKNGPSEYQSFFKGTVFEGKTEGGLTLPKYPGPISSEGVFHTMADRLSQGSRGGILKIFDEVGGGALKDNPKIKLGELNMAGANGLGKFQDLLETSLTNTQKQLLALQEHTKKMGQLNGEQIKTLNSLTDQAYKRLDKQKKFISEHMETYPNRQNIEKIELNFKDYAGQQRKYTLTKDTPADEAKNLIDHFLKSEEKINGEPFENFKTKSNFLAQAAVVGSAGLIPAALICPQFHPVRNKSQQPQQVR